MPTTILLPSIEETQLNITFKDGQEPLNVDVTDIDATIADTHAKRPEDISFLTYFCYVFKQTYNRTISKTAANALIVLRADILDSVKKNLHPGPELLDSMESLQETTESLDSSN